MLRPFPGEEADFPPYIQAALQRDRKLQIPVSTLDVSYLIQADKTVIEKRGDWETDREYCDRVARVLADFTSLDEEETDCRWVSSGSKIGSSSYSSSLWESLWELPLDLKELERAPFRAERMTAEERAEKRQSSVERQWRRIWDRCVSERGFAPLDVLIRHEPPKFVLPGGLSDVFDVIRPVPLDLLGRTALLSELVGRDDLLLGKRVDGTCVSETYPTRIGSPISAC